MSIILQTGALYRMFYSTEWHSTERHSPSWYFAERHSAAFHSAGCHLLGVILQSTNLLSVFQLNVVAPYSDFTTNLFFSLISVNWLVQERRNWISTCGQTGVFCLNKLKKTKRFFAFSGEDGDRDRNRNRNRQEVEKIRKENVFILTELFY